MSSPSGTDVTTTVTGLQALLEVVNDAPAHMLVPAPPSIAAVPGLAFAQLTGCNVVVGPGAGTAAGGRNSLQGDKTVQSVYQTYCNLQLS